MKDKRELMFHYYREYSELNFDLFEDISRIIGGREQTYASDRYRFQDWHWDDYDNSFELDECDNDLRLNEQQFRAIQEDLGFHHGWLNHLDGMETYYGLNQDTGKFVESRRQKVKCPKS